MVTKTAEIRWWSTEKSEMWDWFRENIWNDAEDIPDVRTDYYLKPSDGVTGVKWREGNLELKFRTARYELENGAMEGYLKESFPSELMLADLPSDGMISIKKKRRKRMASADRGLIQKMVEDIEEGCQIEFTEVEIDGSSVWYTICFEAFGQKGREKDILKETLGLFPLLETFFALENSCGYAAKLKMLASRSEH